MPPDLTMAAREWKPNEIFWIVKHGIKMSAMPAFGPTHDDAKLWMIAAFVRQLPDMTAAQYAAIPVDMDHDAGDEHHTRGPWRPPTTLVPCHWNDNQKDTHGRQTVQKS